MISTLHWLPFPQRVEYKISLISYKSIHGLAPKYIADFYSPVAITASRARLRSATSGCMTVPSTKTNWFGRRGLFYTGPTQWNSLSNPLRGLTLGQFASALKTHLFQFFTRI